jgi:hypothetical protein
VFPNRVMDELTARPFDEHALWATPCRSNTQSPRQLITTKASVSGGLDLDRLAVGRPADLPRLQHQGLDLVIALNANMISAAFDLLLTG